MSWGLQASGSLRSRSSGCLPLCPCLRTCLAPLRLPLRPASTTASTALPSFLLTLFAGCLVCRWVLFVDERNVPLSSDDSNYKAAHAELLRKVQGAVAWSVVLGR